MYCSRYNRNCEEALFLCCDVPRINGEQTGEECGNCVFCEVEDEQSGTLEH